MLFLEELSYLTLLYWANGCRPRPPPATHDLGEHMSSFSRGRGSPAKQHSLPAEESDLQPDHVAVLPAGVSWLPQLLAQRISPSRPSSTVFLPPAFCLFWPGLTRAHFPSLLSKRGSPGCLFLQRGNFQSYSLLPACLPF